MKNLKKNIKQQSSKKKTKKIFDKYKTSYGKTNVFL